MGVLTFYTCSKYYPFEVMSSYEYCLNGKSTLVDSDISEKELAMFHSMVSAQINQSYKLINYWKNKNTRSFNYKCCKNKILKHEHKIKRLVSFYADELI